MRGLIAIAAALSVTGCVSASRAPVTRTATAAAQPLRDLNLLRDPSAPALQQALLNPYAAPLPRTCATILAGIAELDLALGPDLDDPAYGASDASRLGEELAADAVRDLLGLPYRGIIRRVSGAAEQERMLKRRILAGFVRRSYLKGVGESLGCEPANAPAEVVN